MVIQAIHDISEVCALKGVQNAVLSPGSRCAPLTISFARNEKIKTWTFSDERSAAFQAIGMCQSTKSPTVLVCTSGSAAYNYAPAVAEAYFQHIPLIILTADRPTEWIDQLDGQTIRQTNIYGQHVKKSFQLPDQYEADEAYWHVNRILNEAINCCNDFPKGPVHINVPLREPFYPEVDEELSYSNDIRIIESPKSIETVKVSEIEAIKGFSKILAVIGQTDYDQSLESSLSTDSFPVIADIISNMQQLDNAVIHQDLFLNNIKEEVAESLCPELLITTGKSVISKHLKLFLRKYKPKHHWHIQPNGDVADTFQSLTKVLKGDPAVTIRMMVNQLTEHSDDFQKQMRVNYLQSWKLIDSNTTKTIEASSKNTSFGELLAVNSVLNRIPDNSILHLANSMSVRYANFIGIKNKPVRVYSNRGTSGIDGSNSTAYGYSLTHNETTTLITGDMAFFYDRNAFWNNYDPAKLRIIILNNNGGGIFKMIKGPGDQPELGEFFVTRQTLTARKLSEEFGYQYFHAQNENELQQVLTSFYIPSDKPKVLEIKTNPDNDKMLLSKIRGNLNQA
jgi:2-succinyl-5-enolpyruvyl-6-hydroxy-3-cyclohexene-1-carboxylate synthase